MTSNVYMSCFWLYDVAELYKEPLQFWPSSDMQSAERLNALTRFVVYVGTSLALYKKNKKVGVAMVGIVLLIVLYAKYSNIRCDPKTIVCKARTKRRVHDAVVPSPVIAERDPQGRMFERFEVPDDRGEHLRFLSSLLPRNSL